MAISGWHPRYRTGIESIDAQHEEIFLALARLKSAVRMSGEGEDVDELLGYFARITERHFETEEDFLRLHNYPEFEAHAKEHVAARANFAEIRERYRDDRNALVETIVTFVNDWLKHHICEGDFKYVQFLEARQKNPN